MSVTITAKQRADRRAGRPRARFVVVFLTRLKQEPGVLEILHGASPDGRNVNRDRLGDRG